MTIAVDTNMLVRYLTWGDPTQARAAASVIENGETIAISAIVLRELVWMLRRACSLGAAEVADAIQEIIESRNVTVNRPAAEAGLDPLRRGGEFAGGVIRHDAERARCRDIATFDRAFAALPGAGGLVPR